MLISGFCFSFLNFSCNGIDNKKQASPSYKRYKIPTKISLYGVYIYKRYLHIINETKRTRFEKETLMSCEKIKYKSITGV